jgi:hypothetical protein
LLLAGGGLFAQEPQQPGQPAIPPAATEEVDSDTTAEPFTMARRLRWATIGAVSMRRLSGNIVSAAIATGNDNPPEYGPHWEGFGRRIGQRVAMGATNRALEASIGALWGEDPRYVRARGRPMKSRMFNVVKMAFIARNPEGEFVPAYARYIAVTSNSFISNTWRPDSQATTGDAVRRIPLTFVNRMIGNAFVEFWPDITRPFR